MQKSRIEWCDHTFNPWEGCTEVSPACAHCYAAGRNARFHKGTAVNWGRGAPRRRTTTDYWKQPLRWNKALNNMWACSCGFRENYITTPIPCPSCGGKPWRVRERVFCASLADWLDDEVPAGWLLDLLELIGKTPNLDWLLLTKRPQNWSRLLYTALRNANIPPLGDVRYDWAVNWVERTSVPLNVWIGTTVEDQQRANERIPRLLQIPAKRRFLSCEPLLGPVNLERIVILKSTAPERGKPDVSFPALHGWYGGADEGRTKIDWVITGGESGPKARPSHPEWFRSLRAQCANAGVPFLFKQWGEWAPPATEEQRAAFTKGMGINGALTLSGCFADRGAGLLRVGKKTAGRILDGIEHNAFPTSSVKEKHDMTEEERLEFFLKPLRNRPDAVVSKPGQEPGVSYTRVREDGRVERIPNFGDGT